MAVVQSPSATRGDPHQPDPNESELLFREARRRRRRRRMGWSVAAVVLVLAGVVSVSKLIGRPAPAERTPISSSRSVGAGRTPNTVVGWTSDSRVVVLSTATGKIQRTLASNVSILAPGLPSVSASPEGTVFFESAEAATYNDNVDSGDQILAVPIKGGPIRDVTSGSDPQVSPNGQFLAFISPDPAGTAGEAPYLVSPLGIDIAALSPQGTIVSVRTLAPGPTQLNQGASDLTWSGNSQDLSFNLLNPSTNVTTSWAVSVGAASLAAARRIDLHRGLTWNGYWGRTSDLGLGVQISVSGIQQVVTINPLTGQIVARLFDMPAEVCTASSVAFRQGCSSDFSNDVVGDAGGTGVLVAGAVPLVDGSPTTSGQVFLYRWSSASPSPVRLTQRVLVATWGPPG